MPLSFLDHLRVRPESIVAGAHRALEIADPLVSSTCSSYEAPSAVFAVRTLFPRWLAHFAEIPEPDPRVPYADVAFRLWRFDDGALLAAPGLPQPRPLIAAAVAAVAETPYTLAGWMSAAKRAWAELDVATPREVLATMVHPPPTDHRFHPWDWLFRVQVASALLVVAMAGEPWVDSAACRDLLDVLHGPVDWTTTAAIIGFLSAARYYKSAIPFVAQTLSDLLKRPMSPVWFMCAYEPALTALQDVPGFPDETVEAIRLKLTELESS